MYRLKLRQNSSHMYMPQNRGMLMKADHLVHDSRFWAVIAIFAFLALLIILAVWAGMADGPRTNQPWPIPPYWYGYYW